MVNRSLAPGSGTLRGCAAGYQSGLRVELLQRSVLSLSDCKWVRLSSCVRLGGQNARVGCLRLLGSRAGTTGHAQRRRRPAGQGVRALPRWSPTWAARASTRQGRHPWLAYIPATVWDAIPRCWPPERDAPSSHSRGPRGLRRGHPVLLLGERYDLKDARRVAAWKSRGYGGRRTSRPVKGALASAASRGMQRCAAGSCGWLYAPTQPAKPDHLAPGFALDG
jgi:hypothetical protein